MEKQKIEIWLQEADWTYANLGEYRREDLEDLMRRFNESGADRVTIIDGECSFYKERIETDEEFEIRQKREQEAKKLVQKIEFERAKKTYLKFKDQFEK